MSVIVIAVINSCGSFDAEVHKHRAHFRGRSRDTRRRVWLDAQSCDIVTALCCYRCDIVLLYLLLLFTTVQLLYHQHKSVNVFSYSLPSKKAHGLSVTWHYTTFWEKIEMLIYSKFSESMSLNPTLLDWKPWWDAVSCGDWDKHTCHIKGMF